MANAPKLVRCAIYTRKSSEEGLEQDFNSLDAQREAGEAYIKSQKHEGWEALPDRYDDGGYSGGTLERPALDDLLAHIRQKKIDVVVVYKIDRLTRSLFDFSKIVEIFEAGGVSFVSVTQQFNTTTSMGRLTLNVLLSFAQFEREVTGERIRDKIAASKKKGMWMGGVVPLGYRVVKRELLIDELESQQVRKVYGLYLDLGTVRAVKAEVDRMAITSRATARTPGVLLGRGHIYRILTNPIYRGKISHKGVLSDGQHKAIIAPEIWDEVQKRLAGNNARERMQPNAAVPSPLAGIIFDLKGERITPSHAVKGGKRYRYYISNVLIKEAGRSDGLRISAPEVEGAVCKIIRGLLNEPQQVATLISSTDANPAEIGEFVQAANSFVARHCKRTPYEQLRMLRSAIARVAIGSQKITVSLHRGILEALIRGTVAESPDLDCSADDQPLHTITLPLRLGRRGRETRLILQASTADIRPVDRSLLTMVARGYAWRHQLVIGEATSALEIARREKVTDSYVSRITSLGFLAPDILAAIAGGTQPVSLTANKLKAIRNIPVDWPSQRQVLGF